MGKVRGHEAPMEIRAAIGHMETRSVEDQRYLPPAKGGRRTMSGGAGSSDGS